MGRATDGAGEEYPVSSYTSNSDAFLYQIPKQPLKFLPKMLFQCEEWKDNPYQLGQRRGLGQVRLLR